VARKKGFRYDTQTVSARPTDRLREGAFGMKLGTNLGMMLLGIFLVLYGLVPLLNLRFQGYESVLQVLAIAAGALILMNK
jgi:hypothetical protein